MGSLVEFLDSRKIPRSDPVHGGLQGCGACRNAHEGPLAAEGPFRGLPTCVPLVKRMACEPQTPESRKQAFVSGFGRDPEVPFQPSLNLLCFTASGTVGIARRPDKAQALRRSSCKKRGQQDFWRPTSA